MDYYYDDYYYYDDVVEEAAGIAIGTFIVAFLISIAIAIVCGLISKKINEGKGRYGGFAWGFFLGVIGIIVVACRSDLHSYNNYEYKMNPEYDESLKKLSKESDDNRLLQEGGWRCNKCNKVNPKYQSTCDCGMMWTKNKDYISEQKREEEKQVINSIKGELESFKQMFDEGLITQEEYDAKKKQILGL